MKNVKFISKILAHEAIQNYAFIKLIAEEEYICDFKRIPYKKPNINNLTPSQRKFMINIMKKLGTAGCVINYDKEYSFSGILHPPLPTLWVSRHTEEMSWTKAHIFSKEEINEYIAHFALTETPEDICMCYDSGYDYSGAGGPYSHEGYVKVTRNRFIHKQSGGLDI